MLKLNNHVCGRWVECEGSESTLYNPSTGEEMAETSTAGLDRREALEFARTTGGENLRCLTYLERGTLLKGISSALHEHREELIDLAVTNGGNTRGDAKFDIDGGIGTLTYYASLGRKLGESRHWLDGDAVDMGASSRMQGRHIRVPRQGCAIHINAFNFPTWGFAEKAACAILGGMPVMFKPATLTSLLAHRVVEIIVEAEILPQGVLSMICGSVGDLLDHVDFQDCIAFTGSAVTGGKIRTHPAVVEKGVRVNVEADSLNCAILGADVDGDSETLDLFVRDVVTDMTQKAGQKCTAIRRVLVPAETVELVLERVEESLARIIVGNPQENGVRMGPLAGASQLEDARTGLAKLLESTSVALGDPEKVEPAGDGTANGCFLGPVVLRAESADSAGAVHDTEVFGPVCTIIPYDGSAKDASRIARMGQGGLVASFYSDDRGFAAELIDSMAPYQGRLVWGSRKVAGQAPGPGTVFPQFVHGGPGRAGGGEELGARRGMEFYTNRVALQGYGPILERMFNDQGE